MKKYKDLVPQSPAEGISKQKDFPDSKFYRVDCECGCDNNIDFFVEIDEFNVSTTFCSKTKTKYWYQTFHISYSEPWLLLNLKQLANDVINRCTIAWRGLVHGYMETESCVILSPQQCVNFVATLNEVNEQFEVLVNERLAKHEAVKKAEKTKKKNAKTDDTKN